MSAYDKVIQGLKHVPASVGIKALEKLDPRFKNFFTSALSYGLDANRALDYLVDRFGGGQPKQNLQSNQPRPDEKVAQNEIEASGIPVRLVKSGAALGLGALGAGARLGGAVAGAASQAMPQKTQQTQLSPESPSRGGASTFIARFPELGKFLDERINAGSPPPQAAVEAKSVKKFQPQINEIETDMEQPFEDLVASLFQGTEKFTGAAPKKQGISQALQMLQQLQEQLKGRRG